MSSEERNQLFEERLPHWEGYIFNLASELRNFRIADKGLFGVEDVQQILRMALWRAISNYDPERGCALDTWIINMLKQQGSLLVQSQFNNIPRNEEAEPLPIESLYVDKGDVSYTREIEDVGSTYAFEQIDEDDEREILYESFRAVLKKRTSWDEHEAFEMIISGRYQTATEISQALNTNFANIHALLLKLRVWYCILHHLPIHNYTSAKEADILWTRLMPVYGKQKEQLTLT